MSTPVTTKSPDVSLYPMGDPSYITRIGFSDLDQDETWMYIPDKSTNASNGSRILRVNVDTLEPEIWLDVGVLPPQVTGLCFTNDYSAFILCVAGDTSLYLLDFASKSLSTIGDVGVNFDVLYRAVGFDFYIGFSVVVKDLYKIDLSGSPSASIYATSSGWTPSINVGRDGSIYRFVQHGGPTTYGPVIRILPNVFPISNVVAGYFLNGDAIGNPFYSAFSTGRGVAVNDDGNVIYILNIYKLSVVYNNNVYDLGGDDSITIQGIAKIKNKLITGNQTLVNIWT